MADIVCADVMDWARDYDGPKFHALLCDPPYHLHSTVKRFGNEGSARAKGGVYRRCSRGFMGKKWDGGDIAYRSETWAALAKHLHPGAFGMAFASARGWHRLAVAIEDAGLRIHPSIFGWSYGSGFPKATRIDTQVDKRKGFKSGFEHEVQDFLNEGRIAPLRSHGHCPMQSHKSNGNGCFYYCRFFQSKLKTPTREEYLQMIDNIITALEESA